MQLTTIQVPFQIKNPSPYMGYMIHPIFNYSDGTSDFEVYEGDDEKGWLFRRCTLSYVKQVLGEMREEKPHTFFVEHSNRPAVQLNSFTDALLFAIKYNGGIVL